MNELPLPAFEHAIQAKHGARSRFVGRERIVETFQNRTVWEGEVLVFELLDHPSASKCYAWSVEKLVTAVLHEPPVNSPQAAVRAAIVANHKGGRNAVPE